MPAVSVPIFWRQQFFDVTVLLVHQSAEVPKVLKAVYKFS